MLAEYVYGNLTLRDFLDIDIIVRPFDAPRARVLLNEAGYRETTGANDLGYLAQLGQCALRSNATGCTVDLHWKLSPYSFPFPFPESEIWDHLQELALAGVSVPTFSWEHLALFLAFHGTKERWRKLKWICDFSALYTARPELDWEALRRKAAQNHCSRSLLVASCLCDALGFPAPPGLVESGNRNPAVGRLVGRVLSRLENPPEETELSVFLDAIAAMERRRDKARLCLTLLTVPTVSDFEAIRLPARLRRLYYLIRPFRLVAKVAGLLYRSRAAR